MRLLDAPIKKQAADLTDEQKREMMTKILIGAGGGAGVGALTQYLMTGKAGLMGAGLGAAGGAAAGAGMSDNARRKIREMFTGEEKPEEEPPVEEPETEEPKTEEAATEEEAPQELTPEEEEARREAVSQHLKSIIANPDKYGEEKVAQAKQATTILNLQKSAPNVIKDIEDPNMANLALNYSQMFLDKHGKTPTDKELGSMLNAAISGELREDKDFEEFATGMHDSQITWKDNQVANMLGVSDEMARILGPKVLPHTVTPAVLMRLGVKGPMLREAIKRAHYAKPLGALGNVPLLRRLPFIGKGGLVNQATSTAMANAPGAIQTGKAGLGARALSVGKGAKNLLGTGFLFNPYAMAINLVMDSPTAFVDPKTGKWNRNVLQNALNHSELMYKRQQKQSELGQHARGFGTGRFMPVRSLMVSGARVHERDKMLEDIAKEKSPWEATEAAKAWRKAFLTLGMGGDYKDKDTWQADRVRKLRAAYQYALDKKYKDPELGAFKIADRYDPEEFARQIRAGYRPRKLPDGKWGYYNPETGGTKGQTYALNPKTGKFDPTDPYGKRGALFNLLGPEVARRVASSGAYRQTPLNSQELMEIRGVPWTDVWRHQGMPGGAL